MASIKFCSYFLALLILCACSAPSGRPLTLQAAAENAVREAGPLTPVTSPTILLRQSVSLGELALFTYEANDPNGNRQLVTGTYLFQRSGLGWTPRSGAISMRPLDEPQQGIDFSAGGGLTDDISYAVAGGLVHDPRIKEVAVTFADGTQQVIAVTNGAYLAGKTGVERVTKIEALDDQGVPIHSQGF